MDDFYDRRDGSGGGFMVGLFTGALLGAGLGLLLRAENGLRAAAAVEDARWRSGGYGRSRLPPRSGHGQRSGRPRP